jgi:hypothetical protein
VKHAVAAAGAAVLLSVLVPAPAVLAQEPIELVPHRAVYDLSLGTTRGNSQVADVRGRIVYDFSGSACEGYSLDFRQVSELNSGEGKTSTSDLRSKTWENAKATSFKFSSENYIDENLTGSVEGQATRDETATAVTLTKPEQKTVNLDPDVVFPTQHMVRAIAGAHAGKSILQFPVYDGSETGDKIFNTLTVIGRRLAPDEHKHDDAAANEPKLADVSRWPVTISYFDTGKKAQAGDETPAYAISFELYDNGISRALSLDYNDFVVIGKLTSLEIKQPKPCP